MRPEGDASCFYDLPSWDALLESAGAEKAEAGRVGAWLGGVLGASRKMV
ncbi:hypothetical protein IMZ48_40865 [Candidatus Bathyarchaeota archaeon]|nr:hypothetical protein [Candidatus Bathyarchaeota archaeon]